MEKNLMSKHEGYVKALDDVSEKLKQLYNEYYDQHDMNALYAIDSAMQLLSELRDKSLRM